MARLSTQVLKVLRARKDFDLWWEDIYPEVQREIRAELDALASPSEPTKEEN